jgi:hypothetical protein
VEYLTAIARILRAIRQDLEESMMHANERDDPQVREHDLDRSRRTIMTTAAALPGAQDVTGNVVFLDDRELATILAALRYWQRNDAAQGPESCIATNMGAFPPLGDEEIDMLCEQINLQHEANAMRVDAGA